MFNVLKFNIREDALGGTRELLHVVASLCSCLFKIIGIARETIHQTCKVLIACYLESTLTGFQTLSLVELLIVRAKDDGHIPNRCFQRVMDTNTKTSAYVGHVSIVIDAGEETEAVDDEDITRGER